MKKCADVVVTYNRKKLLEENIKALLSQTYKNHDLLIIDNASTDGTEEMVSKIKDKRIKYYNTGKNLGGAGGFNYGLKIALKEKYDYAWVMDDDSIPDNKALESLINKAKLIKDDFSYLASLVYWTDNELFPMNVPTFTLNNKMDLKIDYISKYKLMNIKTASFVGCFINLKCAKNVGLPISEFFIYGDDVEYTQRLVKENSAYLDLDSIIVHKAPSNKGADIVTAPKDRLQRFYYQSRNGVYIARKSKTKFKRFKLLIKRLIKILLKSPNYKFKRIWLLIKGSIAGLFFNPKIQYINDEVTNEKI